jgi:hypothetical protein
VECDLGQKHTRKNRSTHVGRKQAKPPSAASRHHVLNFPRPVVPPFESWQKRVQSVWDANNSLHAPYTCGLHRRPISFLVGILCNELVIASIQLQNLRPNDMIGIIIIIKVSFISRVTATHVNPMIPSPPFRFHALGQSCASTYGGRHLTLTLHSGHLNLTPFG